MEDKTNRTNVRAELDLMREYIDTMKKSDIFTDADSLLIHLDNIDTYLDMDIRAIYGKMKDVDFGESMCDETKLTVLKWVWSTRQVQLSPSCQTCKYEYNTKEEEPCIWCFQHYNKWQSKNK